MVLLRPQLLCWQLTAGGRGWVALRSASRRGRSRRGGQIRDRGGFRSGATGPRRSTAATHSPRELKRAADLEPPPSRQPADRIAPARERKDGDLRVRSAPPAGVGTELGHTQRPRRQRGAGRPRLPNLRPGLSQRPSSSGPVASVRVPGPYSAPEGGKGIPGGGGQGSELTSVPIARHSVPGRGPGSGARSLRGRHSGGGGPSGAEGGLRRSRCLGRARCPELAPRCRRSRRRAQPAQPPTGFLH